MAGFRMAEFLRSNQQMTCPVYCNWDGRNLTAGDGFAALGRVSREVKKVTRSVFFFF